MHRTRLLLLFLFLIQQSFAQELEIRKTSDPYFELVRPNYTGELAYNTVAFVEQYWRVAGNTGFNESVYWIAEKLEEAGYILEENAKETHRLTYRIERRKMNRPTWEPKGSELWIAGEESPLLSFESNRNMIYQYSSSTSEEGVVGELLYVRDKSDLQGVDLNGKIVFSDTFGYRNLLPALNEGALGLLIYDMPGYLKPEKNKTSIQFRGIRYQEEKPVWALALSYESKEALKKRYESGRTKVRVKVDTKIYESEELTIIANIRGSEMPDESLVFSAHIQEPGANDNASGVGAQLEMATLTAKLIDEEDLELNRTLTFLWGDEIRSTQRYIEDKERRKSEIIWGISLDMVGENTDLTGGSFLIEKMPDPSAIWTRGEDKHSEWGGSVMKKDEMTPHYFNDFIINIFEQQGEYASWEVNTNPFEGGSDHIPFLYADIPGLLLWHFTDQFYHTDQDRLDKVSQETLKNVATGALVSAFTLLNANVETANQLAKLTLTKAKERLQTEFNLSMVSIQEGNDPNAEIEIIKTWTDWYLGALSSIDHLGSTRTSAFQEELRQFSDGQINQLKK